MRRGVSLESLTLRGPAGNSTKQLLYIVPMRRPFSEEYETFFAQLYAVLPALNKRPTPTSSMPEEFLKEYSENHVEYRKIYAAYERALKAYKEKKIAYDKKFAQGKAQEPAPVAPPLPPGPEIPTLRKQAPPVARSTSDVKVGCLDTRDRSATEGGKERSERFSGGPGTTLGPGTEYPAEEASATEDEVQEVSSEGQKENSLEAAQAKATPPAPTGFFQGTVLTSSLERSAGPTAKFRYTVTGTIVTDMPIPQFAEFTVPLSGPCTMLPTLKTVEVIEEEQHEVQHRSRARRAGQATPANGSSKRQNNRPDPTN